REGTAARTRARRRAAGGAAEGPGAPPPSGPSPPESASSLLAPATHTKCGRSHRCTKRGAPRFPSAHVEHRDVRGGPRPEGHEASADAARNEERGPVHLVAAPRIDLAHGAGHEDRPMSGQGDVPAVRVAAQEQMNPAPADPQEAVRRVTDGDA